MKTIPTYRGVVHPWHCDHMGHMNVMYYVGKFDEATWNLFAEIGITASYMRETQSGVAGVQQNITYRRELFPGDTVEIRSHILSIGERKMTFVHEMRDTQRDEVSAVCELIAVHMDRANRRSSPFPPEVRRRAEALIAD